MPSVLAPPRKPSPVRTPAHLRQADTPLERAAKWLMAEASDLPWLNPEETDDWHSPAHDLLTAAWDDDEAANVLDSHAARFGGLRTVCRGCDWAVITHKRGLQESAHAAHQAAMLREWLLEPP